MAEEENIAGELHGHLTQMLRTAMSGGLQITEQRARKAQQVAEAERRLAMETARRMEERRRAEAEMNVLLAQQRRDQKDTEQMAERMAERTADANKPSEASVDANASAFPKPVEDALGADRRESAVHAAKPCHQRERGMAGAATGVER